MPSKPVLKKVPSLGNPMGAIGVLENLELVPFVIQRVYFIHKVPQGATRGSHAHKKLEQFIVAVSGSFSVNLDDGLTTEIFRLDSPEMGLYVPPGYWRDLIDFSENSVCLVLASTKYDESDYIRNYDNFLSWSGKKQ